METERLKKIEEIYHAALESSPAERAEFLNGVCDGDEILLREVESLIACDAEISEEFLEVPPVSLVSEMLCERNENDLPGKTIGHFEIKKLLGKGGMGEVYLAEDTKLDRRVALKFLPPEFVRNTDRLNRFIREAKSASALNHPNILTIYEIGDFEGAHFIATEFIDGKTLSEYLKSDSINLNSTLDIAIQIASALDEAHSAAIVHRDIKPDNVMIRANGLVKILDFGIAKLSETTAVEVISETSNGNVKAFAAAHSSILKTMTSAGAIIGTAGYMSPEQARGAEIDTRTDIFSFGVLVYEMLSGKLPFEGETATETIAAITGKEPKSLDDSAIPPEIEKIIAKCLRKDRKERYQTIKEVFNDLNDAKQHLSEGAKHQRAIHTTDEREPNTKSRVAVSTKEITSRRFTANKWLAILLAFLVISATAFFAYRYFNPAKRIASIAVMPFVNESGSADVEYLSDGMTETLIRNLSNIPNLSIKARSTVFIYKDKNAAPNKIGAELNVDAVLLGRLVQRGDELKLHLELVDTASQNVLWAENYDRRMRDLASLQSEIASDVSDKLRLKLTAAEQKQVAKIYTTNAEAQQLYLKGRFHWNKRNVKDFELSIGYFKQAVEKDPNYALAYSGLADAYALMPLYGDFRPKDFMPQAKQSALRALELDPNLAEAHASLGRILNSYDFDWNGAEREFKKAISLNPNYPTVHQWYAEFLAFRGMHDEALKEISKALELDPFSLTINRMKGNILNFAERHDEALDQLNKTAELYPESALVRFNIGDVFVSKKMYGEAVAQYLGALRLDGKNASELQKFETAYRTQGWNGFWREYLSDLLIERKAVLEASENAYFKNESVAFAYAATRNGETALQFLNKAFEERDPDLISIKMSEVYDFLNADSRFQELTQKIGLPE